DAKRPAAAREDAEAHEQDEGRHAEARREPRAGDRRDGQQAEDRDAYVHRAILPWPGERPDPAPGRRRARTGTPPAPPRRHALTALRPGGAPGSAPTPRRAREPLRLRTWTEATGRSLSSPTTA